MFLLSVEFIGRMTVSSYFDVDGWDTGHGVAQQGHSGHESASHFGDKGDEEVKIVSSRGS